MEHIAGVINLIFTLGLMWSGITYIFHKLQLGEKYIVKRIVPILVHIDANGLPELRNSFTRIDQRMLYIAWSLKDSRLIPKHRRIDCQNVCKAAQDLINNKHANPNSELTMKYFLQQYK